MNDRESGQQVGRDWASRYWEPWLSMWRTSSLLLVEPWDNAMRAFRERAQLLPRRMRGLGVAPDMLPPATVRQLVERCIACESPEQCEWDLREDPANPVWQAYCPNSETLMRLPRLASTET
jgi:hypothetical protein